MLKILKKIQLQGLTTLKIFEQEGLKQGWHQSAQFEFPDFFGALFPDLMTQIHGYRVKSRAKRGKNLHLQPLGFYKYMPRNQGQSLGHLSQIIFPDFP